METLKFEIGKTYQHGWIGDSNLFTQYTVVKRTKCFVTLSTKGGKEVRCKVSVCRFDNVEKCYPSGQYSMAPILRASKEVTTGDITTSPKGCQDSDNTIA